MFIIQATGVFVRGKSFQASLISMFVKRDRLVAPNVKNGRHSGGYQQQIYVVYQGAPLG